jgi:hypothetical protein
VIPSDELIVTAEGALETVAFTVIKWSTVTLTPAGGTAPPSQVAPVFQSPVW